MSEQSGRGEPGRRQPGSDVLTDLQRWLIRSSARNMRSQFEDQIRRTLGGQRPDNSDVWDVATTEIPPEVGEAPECQWCPICRAARRMRDSRPGLAGQLSGAGDAVASAMQEAVRAFDTFLARATGGSVPGSGPAQGGDPGDASGTEPDAHPSPQPGRTGAARPDSLAGEHGPVGWKPGDRLATAGASVADPWASATAPGEPVAGATSDAGTSDGGASDAGTSDAGTSDGGASDSGDGGADGGGSSGGPASGGPDGRGHGPSDRG